MNKQLGSGALFILSLILLYFGGVIHGAIGAGLSVGGFICFLLSIVGGLKKLFRRSSTKTIDARKLLAHTKRISDVTEHFYDTIVNKSAPQLSKEDVYFEIAGLCLYMTLTKVAQAGYSANDSKQMLNELAQHTSFYLDGTVEKKNRYVRACTMWIDIVGGRGTVQDAKNEMTRYIDRKYHLPSKANEQAKAFIDRLDTLLGTGELVG